MNNEKLLKDLSKDLKSHLKTVNWDEKDFRTSIQHNTIFPGLNERLQKRLTNDELITPSELQAYGALFFIAGMLDKEYKECEEWEKNSSYN